MSSAADTLCSKRCASGERLTDRGQRRERESDRLPREAMKSDEAVGQSLDRSIARSIGRSVLCQRHATASVSPRAIASADSRDRLWVSEKGGEREGLSSQQHRVMTGWKPRELIRTEYGPAKCEEEEELLLLLLLWSSSVAALRTKRAAATVVAAATVAAATVAARGIRRRRGRIGWCAAFAGDSGRERTRRATRTR